MKPWDGIVGKEEQKVYDAAGFARSSGIDECPSLADHRCAVLHDRHGARGSPGIDQRIPYFLR